MNRKKWKNKIKRACKAAGTYQPFFDATIDALSEILEMRDNALTQFEESGGQTVISYTNKNGVENRIKNPALVVLMDCHAQALTFWRELGLTPAGLKRVNEKGLEIKEQHDGKTVLALIREKHEK